MPSGAQVHRSIVARVERVEAELRELVARSGDLEGELARLEAREAEALRGLAEFHLPEMTAEAAAESLAPVRERIAALLSAKAEERRELERGMEDARRRLERLRDELAEATERLNEVGAERDRLARVVADDLAARDGYPELARRTLRARERVARNQRRHEAALRERSENVPAYEADPLFSYLAGRRYGTPQAEGNLLTRRLDDWVADVVGWEEARASYDFLHELPRRVGEALAEERTRLAELEAELGAVEKESADRHGLTEVLERGDALYAERTRLIEAIEKTEAEDRRLSERHARLEDNRGEYWGRAVAALEEHLADTSLEALVARARATGDPRDDELVAELDEVRTALEDVRHRFPPLLARREALGEKLSGLHDLQDEFLKNDFDGRRSTFGRGFDVDALLLGYLAGHHGAAHVTRQLHSRQSFQVDTSSWGGGGFGGGGGFSTGGGFGGGGGGGFSTGGGF